MDTKDNALFLLAQRRRERLQKKGKITNWYGRRGGSVQRKYVCYLCDCVIDTESAKSPQTIHAHEAIEAHGLGHLKEHNLAVLL